MTNRIVVLGGGESGTGSAILAKKQGYEVFLSDNGNIKDKYKEMLYNYDIPWEEKKHTERLILDAEEIIKSPGIPERSPIIQTIRKNEIRIISEIEFAGRHTHGQENLHYRQQREDHDHLPDPSYAEESGDECRYCQGISERVLPSRSQRKHMNIMYWNSVASSWMACLISRQILPFC